MSFLAKLGKLFSAPATSASTGAVSKSRSVAKDRLSVILASQRGSELLDGVDMDSLQKDVLEVVKKHIQVASNRPVNCQVRNEGDVHLFEMSVEIGGNRPASVTMQTAQQ